jgi:hypothetical protein
MSEQAPVLIIGYNRLDHLENQIRNCVSFNRRILISLDGSKNEVDLESIRCRNFVAQIRDAKPEWLIAANINEVNKGCKYGVSDAISWGFSICEELIILEDDVTTGPLFFEFMDWGLKTFKRNHEIFLINGWNPLPFNDFAYSFDYFQSRHFSPWGWSTWANRWQLYDRELTGFGGKCTRELKLLPGLNDYNLNNQFLRLMKSKFLQCKKGYDTWDYQLLFSMWKSNTKSILPRMRMSGHAGFDQRATHAREILHYHESSMFQPIFVSQDSENAGLNPIKEIAGGPSLDHEIDRILYGFTTKRHFRTSLINNFKILSAKFGLKKSC